MKKSAFCLILFEECQLFVYFFSNSNLMKVSCLFTILTKVSCLLTLFVESQLHVGSFFKKAAVCLLFVKKNEFSVYFISEEN